MKRRLGDRRVIGVAVLAIALVVVATLAPHPSVLQIREWARSIGPAFPLVFFSVHALVTVFPFPRTVFTLSAGLLFGPWLGIAITVAAATVSAVLALYLVRAIGRDVVWQRISSPTIRRVDERIARRGWLAVGSLRLIAFVPFSVVNYCCGVSSIRLLPYVLATVVGVLPGTVGIVVLGDALSGETNPALLLLSGVCIVVGIAGLIVDSRRPLDRLDAEDSPAELPVESKSIPQP
ncbi:TVP38/TMEM64 family protein [Rhodococcus tibetensis]|uniref:TVP38/TMEM64 family membrane protein n=1 Tax=Rhodococcus tibetensis TaxID=2965064 RepID=A0ABT1QBM2_9NOCA|nr:TVP38/TMEM64 family protein [Rhodococcus sp. FXJ9.536]MCQ4118495.1 TVP38/TMEM64 family protein [Rhodococcus sp. FXJ9.536]